jgi:hypothetical protein
LLPCVQWKWTLSPLLCTGFPGFAWFFHCGLCGFGFALVRNVALASWSLFRSEPEKRNWLAQEFALAVHCVPCIPDAVSSRVPIFWLQNSLWQWLCHI